MGISKYINPSSISPNEKYISISNLKDDVIEYIVGNGNDVNSEIVSDMIQSAIDSNNEIIQNELSYKMDKAITVGYDRLMYEMEGNRLTPGQYYIITDYVPMLNQADIDLKTIQKITFPISVDGVRTDHVFYVQSQILIMADSENTLCEDALLIRDFWYSPEKNFRNIYKIKYNPYPTDKPGTTVSTFRTTVPYFSIFTGQVTASDGIFDIQNGTVRYDLMSTFQCTEHVVRAYESGNTTEMFNFMEFKHHDDYLYIKMSNSTDIPAVTSGTKAYTLTTDGTNFTCAEYGLIKIGTDSYTGCIYYMEDSFGNSAEHEFDILVFNGSMSFGSLDYPVFSNNSRRPVLFGNKIYDGDRKVSSGRNILITPNSIGDDGTQAIENIIEPHSTNVYIRAFSSKNHILSDCSSITIENSADNEIGNGSEQIVLSGAYHNIIGTGNASVDITQSNNNTIGLGCLDINLQGSFDNKIGSGCSRIETIGANNNIFGDRCLGITFENGCQFNTFGDLCSYITLGQNCLNNTFGNDVTGVLFKTSASLNATNLSKVRYFNIGDGSKGLVLCGTPSDSATQFYQNVEIVNAFREFSIDNPEYRFVPLDRYTQYNSQYKTIITKARDLSNVVYNDGDVVVKLNDIGDLSSLSTSDKSNLVQAVNELYTKIDEELVELELIMRQLQTNDEQLGADYSNLKTTVTSNSSKIAQAQLKITSITEKVDTINTLLKIDSETNAIDEINTNIENNQNELILHDSRITELENIGDTLDEHDVRLTDYGTQIDDLRTDLDAQSEIIDALDFDSGNGVLVFNKYDASSNISTMNTVYKDIFRTDNFGMLAFDPEQDQEIIPMQDYQIAYMGYDLNCFCYVHKNASLVSIPPQEETIDGVTTVTHNFQFGPVGDGTIPPAFINAHPSDTIRKNYNDDVLENSDIHKLGLAPKNNRIFKLQNGENTSVEFYISLRNKLIRVDELVDRGYLTDVIGSLSDGQGTLEENVAAQLLELGNDIASLETDLNKYKSEFKSNIKYYPDHDTFSNASKTGGVLYLIGS